MMDFWWSILHVIPFPVLFLIALVLELGWLYAVSVLVTKNWKEVKKRDYWDRAPENRLSSLFIILFANFLMSFAIVIPLFIFLFPICIIGGLFGSAIFILGCYVVIKVAPESSEAVWINNLKDKYLKKTVDKEVK